MSCQTKDCVELWTYVLDGGAPCSRVSSQEALEGGQKLGSRAGKTRLVSEGGL